MANGGGFFLGGMAEGEMGARKQVLAEQTQQQDVGLRTRGLELQERQLENTIGQQAQAQIDKQLSETFDVLSETIKAARQVGKTPDQIMAGIAQTVEIAKAIAAKGGRDPNAVTARVNALMTSPTLVEAGTAKGQASAAQRVSEAQGIAAATGSGVDISPYKTDEERVKLENSLRDDYTKASKDFIVVRDFMDRIRGAPATGAGDLSLVFSYMKVLDPTSTVREGEYANAQNAAGVPSAVQGMWNKLLGGGSLDAEARKQIRDSAGKIWTSAATRHNAITNQYASIAKRNKLRVDNVIVDFNAGGGAAPVSGTTSTGIRWNWRGD